MPARDGAYPDDGFPAAFLVFDSRGVVREASRTCAGFLHTTGRILKNKRFSRLLRSETDRALFSAHIRNALRRGTPGTCEVSLKKKDGGSRVIEIYSVASGSSPGAYRAIRSMVVDITERRETETLLRRSEEAFRLAFENSHDAIFWVDLKDGTIVNCNNAAEMMMSAERMDLIGGHMSSLHPPELVKYYAALFKKGMMNQRGSLDREAVVLSKKGKRIAVHITTSIVHRGDRKILQGVFRDITERKKSEAVLRQELCRMNGEESGAEAGVGAIGDNIAVIARDFRIVFQNRSNRQMFGIHVGERCDKAFEGTESTCANCPVSRSFRDGKSHRGRRTMKGRKRIDITAHPIHDASGTVIAVIESARDMAGLKKTEDMLRRSRGALEGIVDARAAELARTNKQLRGLSAYLQNAREKERTLIAREIHDELGQSLTALKMDLSLFRKKLPLDEHQAAEKIESMNSLIEKTINDIKRISMELRPGILDHLGLGAAVEWQTRDFEKRTGILCAVSVEPEDLVLDRDRTTMVFRILQETLTNVARHAGATKVAVVMERRYKKLLLRVSDNGKGIRPGQCADPASVGLIGMRERVVPWGGTLTIVGTRNKGTTVTLNIPLADGMPE